MMLPHTTLHTMLPFQPKLSFRPQRKIINKMVETWIFFKERSTIKRSHPYKQPIKTKNNRPATEKTGIILSRRTIMNASTTTMLTGLLSLCFLSPAMAADFSGSLKKVTLTDAQSVNKPPVAAFTYSQDGQTFFFDAAGSSDPDGSISKYKWDFGDGKVAEGITATYSLVGESSFKVTLTVIDNSSGAALSQQTVTPAKGIRDDFTTDTSQNYATITGAITISNGAAHGKQWAQTRVYHTSPFSSSDHFVEADVQYDGGTDSGGLLARVDPTMKTCYQAHFNSGKIVLVKFNGSSQTWIADSNGSYSAGTYNIRLETLNSNIIVYVNGTKKISATDTTYKTGNNAGIYFNRGGRNSDTTVDNLK